MMTEWPSSISTSREAAATTGLRCTSDRSEPEVHCANMTARTCRLVLLVLLVCPETQTATQRKHMAMPTPVAQQDTTGHKGTQRREGITSPIQQRKPPSWDRNLRHTGGQPSPKWPKMPQCAQRAADRLKEAKQELQTPSSGHRGPSLSEQQCVTGQRQPSCAQHAAAAQQDWTPTPTTTKQRQANDATIAAANHTT